jgi:hypothetical protein
MDEIATEYVLADEDADYRPWLDQLVQYVEGREDHGAVAVWSGLWIEGES